MRDLRALEIVPQPTDSTCGPTCLHAIYRHYGEEDTPLEEVIEQVSTLTGGGTLAVLLASHALRRGYQTTIYTYNLQVFDPSWFRDGVDVSAKLAERAAARPGPRIVAAARAYADYLALGGQLRYEELSEALLRRHLSRGVPILTGLSATYLYGCAREIEIGKDKLVYDDVRGDPIGHFVVLCGYDAAQRTVRVADPQPDTPRFGSHYYEAGIERLLGAILLGVLTHDANLLLVEPKT